MDLLERPGTLRPILSCSVSPFVRSSACSRALLQGAAQGPPRHRGSATRVRPDIDQCAIPAILRISAWPHGTKRSKCSVRYFSVRSSGRSESVLPWQHPLAPAIRCQQTLRIAIHRFTLFQTRQIESLSANSPCHCARAKRYQERAEPGLSCSKVRRPLIARSMIFRHGFT